MAALAALSALASAACSEDACDDGLRVDGLVAAGSSCSEYTTAPMVGVYGVVHVAVEGELLQVHNDWLLRDDADTPADAYNRFEFNAADASARVEVRVYRDGRVVTLLDGAEVDLRGHGAATFAPSARKATPHMQYEFVVALPPSAAGKLWWMCEADPPPGPLTPPYDTLVTEPTAILVDASNEGTVVDKGDVPVLSSAHRDGDAVVLVGARLGTGGAVKRNNLRPAQVQTWSAEQVRVTGPAFDVGERIRVVRDDGVSSNAVTLLAADVPPAQPGDCAYRPKGAPCDDGRICSQDDACDGKGGCVGVHQCPDGGACLAGDCTAAGTCGLVPRAVATPCPGGAPCVLSTCDGAGACTQANEPDGKPCDDGKPCTTADVCAAGVCAGVPACPADNPCRVGACDKAGGCAFSDAPDGQGCFDGDHCTTGSVCAGGACVGGSAVDCDDVQPCTVDSCAPSAGCSHVVKAGLPCDDGDPCTIGDACDDAGACQGDPSGSCK